MPFFYLILLVLMFAALIVLIRHAKHSIKESHIIISLTNAHYTYLAEQDIWICSPT